MGWWSVGDWHGSQWSWRRVEGLQGAKFTAMVDIVRVDVVSAVEWTDACKS